MTKRSIKIYIIRPLVSVLSSLMSPSEDLSVSSFTFGQLAQPQLKNANKIKRKRMRATVEI